VSKEAHQNVEQSPAPDSVMTDGDQLAQAERAFEKGDYLLVRRLTRPLTASADPTIANAARALRSRISTDPVHLALLVACCVAFCVIAYNYLFHY
jgi:hypothetical protein